MITRRRFLHLGAAAAGGLLLPLRLGDRAVRAQVGWLDPSGLERFVDPLPIPPIWDLGQLASAGLTMAEDVHRFHRDLGWTRTWGYGGASYLGPTIEAPRGEAVEYVARNRLGPHPLGVDEELHGPDMAEDQTAPRVSVHLHGGYTEPDSDGYPEDTFVPGQDHLYRYENDQQAANLWYHDHALGITRLNVYAGLAAVYLVRDEEVERRLPGPYGVYEIPLVLQDKSFLGAVGDEENPLAYPDPWAPEFFGDVVVVNGKAWPKLDVDQGMYRFRIYNGSSSRFYHLRLSPNVPMLQIGTDTGLLGRATGRSRVVLAPGARVDVLVNFSGLRAGAQVHLMNDPLPPGVESPADVELPVLMRFDVTSRRGHRGPIGMSSPPLRPLPRRVPQRNLTLVEIMEDDEPVMALLNNRPWDTDDIERPAVDTIEQWNLINLTADTHPIHLHLVQFRLLNRQAIDAPRYLMDVYGTEELGPDDVGEGTRPFPSADGYAIGPKRPSGSSERGWKDTVQAHPGTVTRIIVPFGPTAASGVPFGFGRRSDPFTGEYVWHCHILDHEDNEMMLPYEVVEG